MYTIMLPHSDAFDFLLVYLPRHFDRLLDLVDVAAHSSGIVVFPPSLSSQNFADFSEPRLRI